MNVKQIWRKDFCCYYEDSQGIVQSLKLNKGLRNFSSLIGKDSGKCTIACAEREINWGKGNAD